MVTPRDVDRHDRDVAETLRGRDHIVGQRDRGEHLDEHTALFVHLSPESRFPVSYSIYAMARVQRAIAAAGLADLGLFPAQEILLTELDASDGQSQKVLAATMGISHVTVAKMVARLERAGLIVRKTSTTDRRVSLVYPTAAGRTAQEGIHAVWADLEAIVNRELGGQDKRDYLASTTKIRRALDTSSSSIEPGA